MRIDVRAMPWEDGRWFVWNVELCCVLPFTVWVDDDTAQYGVRPHPRAAPLTRQARRIQILFETHTVLINPLDDAEMLESEIEEKKRVGIPS